MPLLKRQVGDKLRGNTILLLATSSPPMLLGVPCMTAFGSKARGQRFLLPRWASHSAVLPSSQANLSMTVLNELRELHVDSDLDR